MAASLRPTLMRQALAAPAQRTLTSAVLPAFRIQRSQPMLKSIPRATFQTSAARSILPPLPQVINGGVNDPVPTPTPHPAHGSYHWSFERAVSIALVPLTAIPFAAGAALPMVDAGLISLLILHSYMGFQSCITDYFPTWRVSFVRKACDWLNFLAIFVVGWGWYEFETNDVGLTEGIKRADDEVGLLGPLKRRDALLTFTAFLPPLEPKVLFAAGLLEVLTYLQSRQLLPLRPHFFSENLRLSSPASHSPQHIRWQPSTIQFLKHSAADSSCCTIRESEIRASLFIVISDDMNAKGKKLQEAKLKELVIYRDNEPKPFVPVTDGITPSIIDLHIPPLSPKDMKKLLRLPEPRRTTKWIQMAFTHDDAHLVDPEVLWRAYKAMFEPLMRKTRKGQDTSPQPLVVNMRFWMILMRAIHGVRPWQKSVQLVLDSSDTKVDANAPIFDGKFVVRGVRARTQALTFPSTNRENQLRQLQFYRSNNQISEPKSLFAQNLAQDPLFMNPTTRTATNKPLGFCEGRENIGFPGVGTVARADNSARPDALWKLSNHGEFDEIQSSERRDLEQHERELKADELAMDKLSTLLESMSLVSASQLEETDADGVDDDDDKGKSKGGAQPRRKAQAEQSDIIVSGHARPRKPKPPGELAHHTQPEPSSPSLVMSSNAMLPTTTGRARWPSAVRPVSGHRHQTTFTTPPPSSAARSLHPLPGA
ncbi:hypothetical protein Q7P37_004730 [Cladosporium fusiforme]